MERKTFAKNLDYPCKKIIYKYFRRDEILRDSRDIVKKVTFDIEQLKFYYKITENTVSYVAFAVREITRHNKKLKQ